MLPAMTVVSVINYKGGVGKTTVTANLGADLAFRGRTVLLIDMDPQASLTFSFYGAAEWERDLEQAGTLLHWFDAFHEDRAAPPLRDYVLSPPRINRLVRPNGGRLDLIASHLGLVDVDLDLAAELGGSRRQLSSPDYLRVHRLLADALDNDDFREYDIILIDCAPNFNIVTRTAIVASRYILVPAKPDYLSTLGIDFLRRKLAELVADYNDVAEGTAGGVQGAAGADINPEILGVIFTMVQYNSTGNIIVALRNAMERLDQIEVPVFQQMVRENKSHYANAGETGIPTVLTGHASTNVQYELEQLTSEFLAKIKT
jgi:chromosome partitioning protein